MSEIAITSSFFVSADGRIRLRKRGPVIGQMYIAGGHWWAEIGGSTGASGCAMAGVHGAKQRALNNALRSAGWITGGSL